MDGTDELEELAARLEEAGHRVRHDTALPGRRRFYVDEGVGNRLEFLARVT